MAVLLNANAKRVNPRVYAQFARLVPESDLFYSETLDDAKAHAHRIIRERYSTVMVGGGDGTITHTMNHLIEAAEALSRSSVRHALPDLGVLRLGTGNGLAHLCGSGKPTNDVLRMLSGTRPPARPLRLIQDAESGWFFPFASLGYDARVLNDYLDVVNTARTQLTRSLAKSLPGYFYALGTRTIPGSSAKSGHIFVWCRSGAPRSSIPRRRKRSRWSREPRCSKEWRGRWRSGPRRSTASA